MRVTVIVPLFNKAGFIRRALDSVFAQTHGDFGVVVVDDGSTDGGGPVVGRQYGSRVTLVETPHRGASEARNTGLEHASTDWVAFLDADDEWLPEFLERTIALVREQPTFGAVFANRRGGVSGPPRLSTRHPRGEMVDHFRFCLENRGTGMHSSALLVRRRALIDCGGFPEGVVHGEDLDTWARLAWSVRVGYLPEVLAIYHTDAPGSLCQLPAAERSEYPQVVRSYRQWRAQGRVPARLEESSENYAHWIMLHHASILVEAGLAKRARDLLRSEYPLTAWPRYGFVRTYLECVVRPRLWPVNWDAGPGDGP